MPYDRDYETRDQYRRRRDRERRLKKKLLRAVTAIVLLLAALIAVVLLLLLRGRMDVMNEEFGAGASASSFKSLYSFSSLIMDFISLLAIIMTAFLILYFFSVGLVVLHCLYYTLIRVLCQEK